jgi:hypothetical protein
MYGVFEIHAWPGKRLIAKFADYDSAREGFDQIAEIAFMDAGGDEAVDILSADWRQFTIEPIKA